MLAHVIEAGPEHLPTISERLRAIDAHDLWEASGMTPIEALHYSMHVSVYSWVWNIDGEPACVFGLAAPSLISACAMPWLITTTAVEQRPIEFLRGSRRMLATMLRLYPALEGYVDARYHVSMQWLRWLGFTIHDAEPMGPLQTPFHRFEIGRT